MARIDCVIDGAVRRGTKPTPRDRLGACAYLVVKSYGSNETGRIELSADLRSPGEIDSYARMLKSDIDRAAKKAKKLLAAAYKRKLASL